MKKLDSKGLSNKNIQFQIPLILKVFGKMSNDNHERPGESSKLISDTAAQNGSTHKAPYTNGTSSYYEEKEIVSKKKKLLFLICAVVTFVILVSIFIYRKVGMAHVGPYRIKQVQKGENLFSFYNFYEGPDIPGSGGFNDYVSYERAKELGILKIESDGSVYMGSAPSGVNNTGKRQSIRLEGKHFFDRGLFVIDLDHMPNGCGVWPAFWLADDDNWPHGGEIDIVEGINYQSIAKIALHTTEGCTMYNQVPEYVKNGTWEWSTGVPDRWTGVPDTKTIKPTDNCWVNAPHQWQNQGCVAVSNSNDTLGGPLNKKGGGVFVLEWDPDNAYIRSWVFTPHKKVPENLVQAMATAEENDHSLRVEPNSTAWGLPYAYFPIGPFYGCSVDHFKSQRLILNLAFCGAVSGNLFFKDCPSIAVNYVNKTIGAPSKFCELYMKTNPKEVNENAYWKINGIYVWERSLAPKQKKKLGDMLIFGPRGLPW